MDYFLDIGPAELFFGTIVLIVFYGRLQADAGEKVNNCRRRVSRFLSKCLEDAGVTEEEALSEFERRVRRGGIILKPRLEGDGWRRCRWVIMSYAFWRYALAAQGIFMFAILGMDTLASSYPDIIEQVVASWIFVNGVAVVVGLAVLVHDSHLRLPRIFG